jgi:Tetratricopeptide repeat.
LQKLASIEKPISSGEKSIELNPQDAQTWYDRGNALEAMGRFQAAIESWEKAIELEPKFPEAWYNKGVALRKLGQLQEAIAAYNEALKNSTRKPRSMVQSRQCDAEVQQVLRGDRLLRKSDRIQARLTTKPGQTSATP